jgi:diadenosine tetraphosphatase ApaH/serine/threonine PP2A family protein phosphatase
MIDLSYPSLPDGQLVYAIGDIHGRLDLLGLLLASIEADAAQSQSTRKTLIFLGDYVDRGPDSRGVIEALLNDLPQDFDAHFLKGNHEALLLKFLEDASCLRHWLVNDAKSTMRSYGMDVNALESENAPAEAWRGAFAAALSESHRHFFQTLALMTTFGDYLFVHAGLRPGIPIEAQDERDLIWIRHEFLDSEDDFGKFVVHGHTPVSLPEVRSNRIDIDTGAVFSGRLTALRLEGSRRGLLHT